MSGKIIAGFGLLMVVMGLRMFFSPDTLPQTAEMFLTPRGLGVAAGMRVILGILLWAASGAARTPRTFKVLGVMFVIGGLAIPFIGRETLRSMVEWGVSQGEVFLRFDALVAVAMGAFFIWSTMSRRHANTLPGDA